MFPQCFCFHTQVMNVAWCVGEFCTVRTVYLAAGCSEKNKVAVCVHSTAIFHSSSCFKKLDCSKEYCLTLQCAESAHISRFL